MPNEPIDLAEHRKRRDQKRSNRGRDPASTSHSDRPSIPGGALFSSPLLRKKDEEPVQPLLGPGEVPCVRCHAPIPGKARRCRSCGLHFTGHAEDFAPKKRLPLWVQVLLVVIVLSLALAAATVDLDHLW